MLTVRVRDDAIQIGRHFSVSFQRTLRIPDDGRDYPLPPGLGAFPISRVKDYARRVPASWRERGGVFIPMYQREALWLAFGAAHWRPTAAKVAIGKINAISGEPWDQTLRAGSQDGVTQDYVVCPDQPWLDGINAGAGYIRQFVAMPLGMGYTVEGQVTGKEELGGIQIVAFDPKPGRFPERLRGRSSLRTGIVCCEAAPGPMYGAEMGLGAGGRMRQEIHPDPYGLDTWDMENTGRVYVHIVNSAMYRDITGMEPPPSPVSARTYTELGLPWFDLYAEGKGDVEPSRVLAGIESVKQKDEKLGFAPQQDDAPVLLSPEQLVTLRADAAEVEDGAW